MARCNVCGTKVNAKKTVYIEKKPLCEQCVENVFQQRKAKMAQDLALPGTVEFFRVPFVVASDMDSPEKMPPLQYGMLSFTNRGCVFFPYGEHPQINVSTIAVVGVLTGGIGGLIYGLIHASRVKKVTNPLKPLIREGLKENDFQKLLANADNVVYFSNQDVAKISFMPGLLTLKNQNKGAASFTFGGCIPKTLLKGWKQFRKEYTACLRGGQSVDSLPLQFPFGQWREEFQAR